jgi:hypothetical protein
MQGDDPPRPPTLDAPLRAGSLEVGAYVLSINDIDLHNNSFNAEFYLFTRWDTRAGDNPSDHVRLLNGISNSDVGRFDLLSSQITAGVEWRLYGVRSTIAHNWVLQDYPFDKQLLTMRLGLGDPLQRGVELVPNRESSYINPELVLYGWQIGIIDVLASRQSVVGDLGMPGVRDAVVHLPTVDVLINMQRRGYLEIIPSFIGYFLAMGLCLLALSIKNNRNDLVLAGVVGAAGNSVYLAQLLPVSGLSGFSGQVQIIVYVGLVYTAVADELLDRISETNATWIEAILRQTLLPLYMIGTTVAIWLALP